MYGLYVSAAGAHVQSKRMEVISNNLANVDTVGFRRDFAVAKARAAEAVERGIVSPGSEGPDDVGGGVQLVETLTDLNAGKYADTGNPTDLAILDGGESFFVVEKEGKRFLTRAGNFNFDGEGFLRTMGGEQVLSQGGTPVRVPPGGPEPRFQTDGTILVGDVRIPLAMERPEQPGDLAKAGENLFAPLGPTSATPLADRRVATGRLETSSVKPVEEMVHLMEAMRTYEANVRMIQYQDQTAGALINRVLGQG